MEKMFKEMLSAELNSRDVGGVGFTRQEEMMARMDRLMTIMERRSTSASAPQDNDGFVDFCLDEDDSNNNIAVIPPHTDEGARDQILCSRTSEEMKKLFLLLDITMGG